MEAWRRRIGGDVARRPIPLELIDTIERDIEPVPALVLDHRHLDGARLDEDGLDPPIDPDAVLEVDDIVARLECRHGLQRDPASVPASTTDPTLATEDLVV